MWIFLNFSARWCYKHRIYKLRTFQDTRVKFITLIQIISSWMCISHTERVPRFILLPLSIEHLILSLPLITLTDLGVISRKKEGQWNRRIASRNIALKRRAKKGENTLTHTYRNNRKPILNLKIFIYFTSEVIKRS